MTNLCLLGRAREGRHSAGDVRDPLVGPNGQNGVVPHIPLWLDPGHVQGKRWAWRTRPCAQPIIEGPVLTQVTADAASAFP